MQLSKLILPAVLVICAASFVSEIKFNTSTAGNGYQVAKVYGPDIHGVVCYRDSRNAASDPLSCVRVY